MLKCGNRRDKKLAKCSSFIGTWWNFEFKRKANKKAEGFSFLRKQGDLALALNASGVSLVKHGSASRPLAVDRGFIQSPSEFGFPFTNCLLALYQRDTWDESPASIEWLRLLFCQCTLQFGICSGLNCWPVLCTNVFFFFRAAVWTRDHFNISLKMQSTFFLSKIWQIAHPATIFLSTDR